MNIDAMLISTDEPQLDRCLKSIQMQTVPFANFIHVNNVVPECDAFNKGLEQVTSDWFMHIAGDFVLYNEAVRIASSYIEPRESRKLCAFHFGLHDTFLDCTIGFCSVLRASVYKPLRYGDKLSNDRNANYDLRKLGWRLKKQLYIILGTHFDSPDEFQIFRRFYTQWIKYPNNAYLKNRLTELREKTENPLYSLALKAGQFADQKRIYPGSHNLDFDRQLFEEFKRVENN